MKTPRLRGPPDAPITRQVHELLGLELQSLWLQTLCYLEPLPTCYSLGVPRGRESVRQVQGPTGTAPRCGWLQGQGHTAQVGWFLP